MEQREKLIELIGEVQYLGGLEGKLADHLLSNGVVVLPCRCVGCESFRNGLCDSEHIGAMIFRMKREETDFCSYGKRKNGVNDAEQK